MARKRATLLLRETPSRLFPPCDMRRYVEMAVGRRRKDMSKAPRVNPAMGPGPIMRNFIVDDYNLYASFDSELRQRTTFPIESVFASGPTSLFDANLFLWRVHVYQFYANQYILADTPLMDVQSELFLNWLSNGIYAVQTRWLTTANHALDVVSHNGLDYKRKADHLIRHFFAPREYLADRRILELAGWDLGNYRLPQPQVAPEPEATDGGREDEYDDDYPEDDDED